MDKQDSLETTSDSVTATAIYRHTMGFEQWHEHECNIAYLVIISDEFIVYLDKEIDVEWTYKFGDGESLEYVRSARFSEILNRVAQAESTPREGLTESVWTPFKRLLGEGVGRALTHDHSGALAAISAANSYITARRHEVSRRWYLLGSAYVTGPFLVIAFLLWLTRDFSMRVLGVTAFWLIMSACAGSLGAMFSVIGRTGKELFDNAAGKYLHHLEAGSRIFAGAISGLLVALAVHAGLFLSAITKNGEMVSIMVIAALASGTSERFATSIIGNLGSDKADETAKTRNHEPVEEP
jgi:hypothetical protein